MSKSGHFIINNKSSEPVMIRIGHAGVVPESIRKTVQASDFTEKLEAREKHSRIILSSVEPLSHFSGIRAKLIAYHKFLKKKSVYQRDCKLIQYIVVPKFEIEDDIDQLRESIKEIETTIINEFGDKVLAIIETNPDDLERYMIWADTDILFITNKRDGLYMSPLEYIVVRSAIGKAK